MTSDEAIAWAKDQLDEGKDGAELKEKILERGYQYQSNTSKGSQSLASISVKAKTESLISWMSKTSRRLMPELAHFLNFITYLMVSVYINLFTRKIIYTKRTHQS